MEHFDLDKALQAQLHAPTPGPAPELDAEPDARAVSLWWLPMVANFIVCGVPAVIFALPIMPLWAHLASFALAWLAVGGVALPFISLRMADLRAATTIYLPKRTRKKEGF